MHKFLKNRTSNLQEQLKKNNIKQLLITNPANITYLTGVYPVSWHEREAFILLSQTKMYLYVSVLSYEAYKALGHVQVEVLGEGKRLTDYLSKHLSKNILHIEADDLKVSEHTKLEQTLKIKTLPISTILNDLRQIKDQYEIELISKACQITKKSFVTVKKVLKEGLTETEVAELLIREQNRRGATGVPVGFEPIVAFGEHSAVPHHISGTKKLRKNDVVLIDFGCTVAGYASDFTRTFVFGEPSQKFVEIEKIVKKAYKTAEAELVSSKRPDLIDKAAAEVLTKAGYKDLIIHTTGHGLGLSIHEAPSLYRHKVQAKMQTGTVITIEPGLYFSGDFGYRYENTLLVTEKGYKRLT